MRGVGYFMTIIDKAFAYVCTFDIQAKAEADELLKRQDKSAERQTENKVKNHRR